MEAYLEVCYNEEELLDLTPRAIRGPIRTSLLHREEGLPPWPLLSPLQSNLNLTRNLNRLIRCYPEVLCLWSHTY